MTTSQFARVKAIADDTRANVNERNVARKLLASHARRQAELAMVRATYATRPIVESLFDRFA